MTNSWRENAESTTCVLKAKQVFWSSIHEFNKKWLVCNSWFAQNVTGYTNKSNVSETKSRAVKTLHLLSKSDYWLTEKCVWTVHDVNSLFFRRHSMQRHLGIHTKTLSICTQFDVILCRVHLFWICFCVDMRKVAFGKYWYMLHWLPHELCTCKIRKTGSFLLSLSPSVEIILNVSVEKYWILPRQRWAGRKLNLTRNTWTDKRPSSSHTQPFVCRSSLPYDYKWIHSVSCLLSFCLYLNIFLSVNPRKM